MSIRHAALLLFACSSPPPPQAPAAPAAPAELVRIVDGVVSAYLLPIDGTQAALVDCGMDPEAKAIQAELAARKLTVTAIFITHLHGDHVGGCERFPNAKLYALGESDPSITALADGQTITLGSLAVTAHAVPGHTPDSVAYLAAGVLYLGDAAMSEGGKVKASPQRFQGAEHAPDTEKLNVPPLRALHDKLVASKAEVRQLAFGHSAPVDGLAGLANPD